MKLNAGKDSKFTVADPCQGEPCKTGQKYHKLLKTRLSQLRHYISWTPVPNFLIFCPYTSVLLCGTLLVLGTLAIARALSSCLFCPISLTENQPCVPVCCLYSGQMLTTSAEIWGWVLNVEKNNGQVKYNLYQLQNILSTYRNGRELLGKWGENKRN